MSGLLFDTNVLLDIATADTAWLTWSEEQLRTAAAQSPIAINPIIYAELAPAFASQSDYMNGLIPRSLNDSYCRIQRVGWRQKLS